MQSILLIRQAPDKRRLRRSLRGKPKPYVIGDEGAATYVYIVYIPDGHIWGLRLARRAWERIERLVRDEGILFALAPHLERRGLSHRLYALGVTLLDGEGVRQYLLIAAMEKWFSLLGREAASEIIACVQGAGTRWGPLWVSFLSGWVRCLAVIGSGAGIEHLQREMLSRDGTVLTVGAPGRADIRVILEAGKPADQRMLIDARPIPEGLIPGAIHCGWPAGPASPAGELDPMESLLAGLYHSAGRRFFAACKPLRHIRNGADIEGVLHKAGVRIKGFLAGDTVITFDRMRHQFYQEWTQSLADRQKTRLDNGANHDI